MPVNRQQSTAFVNVRGLGIVCFNPTLQRCETAIIRHGGHQLSVDIARPGLIDGTEGDTTGFISLFHRPITELEDVMIEISAIGESTHNGFEIFQAGPFDRVNGENDPNDIRWIINLEGNELHGPGLVKNESVSESLKPPVTRLFISDALFYAVLPDSNALANTPYFEKTDPRDDSTNEFGYLAETLGANIQAGGVQIKLTIGGTEEVLTYQHVAGSPLRIEITNVDPDVNGMASDLPVCYQFLRDSTGLEFDLSPVSEDGDSGDGTVGKNFCHITRVELDTIEDFL